MNPAAGAGRGGLQFGNGVPMDLVSTALQMAKPPNAPAPAAAPAWRRGMHALRRLLQALFVRQLRVRRVAGKLALTLEDQANPVARAHAGVAAEATAKDQHPMRSELAALLDGAAGSRKMLRVLAAVEHGLKHKDPTGLFLFEVEPARLRAALRQLDGLMPREPTAALAALRARMADALATREQREKRLEMLMPRSDLMGSGRLEVAEARPSDFDRASAQWTAKDPAA